MTAGAGGNVPTPFETAGSPGQALGTDLFLMDGTGVTFQGAADSFFTGTIASLGGDTGLVKNGTGTLTLTGANTYAGGTTINGGALQIGNGGTSGSIMGNVTDNASLIFDRSDVYTFGGVISGTGSVTQNGTGTLILTAQNTYAGGTTVNAGTFQLGDGTNPAAVRASDGTGSSAGGTAIVVNNAATVNVMANASVTAGNGGPSIAGSAGNGGVGVTFTNGGSLTNYGTITAGIGGSTSSGIAGSGGAGVTFTGGGSLTNNGTITAGSGGGSGLLAAGNGGAGVVMTGGGSLTNSGTITAGNGGNRFAPGVAGGGGTGVVFINGGVLTNSGTISRGSGGSGFLAGADGLGVSFSGASGALINQKGGTITGDVSMDNFANDVTLWIGSKINGKLNIGTDTGAHLILDDDGTGGTQTYSQAVTGMTSFAGSLVKQGSGTWILDAAVGYSGSTTVADGTLRLGTAGALPSGTDLIMGSFLAANAGTLDLNGYDATVNSVSLAPGNTGGANNIITSATSATFTVSSTSTDSTYSGLFTGAIHLVKDGAGTKLTLTGANTFTGGTEIKAGEILLGDGTTPGASLGTGDVIIDAGATLTLDLAGGETFSNNVTDNGHFVADDSPVSNYTISSVISGSGDFTKTGPNTVTLTGDNTYSGGTTINGGTLLVNNTSGSGTGTGGVVINSGGILGGGGRIAGTITLNSGGIIAPGAGTPGVAGTTLHGGSLTLNGGGTLSLQIDGAASDQLALTGALTKGSGSGFNLELTFPSVTQKKYTLVTFASTDFLASDFTLFLPTGYSGSLLETATELDLVLAFSAGGPIIQNAAPVGTPVIADFTVAGPVSTGGSADNNTINSLIFTPGGKLTITNTLTLTSGDVTTAGGNNTIVGGTLYGPNGLHFDVNGNLFIGSTLIGNATKTGAGSLFLDGTLFGNMKVLAGLLGGNGSILGNLINGGLVSPGHSPGQIHVSGNYTQTPSGVLRIEIAGRDITQHDLLSVGGTARLDGTLQLVRLNQFKLKRNKPVTFLTAGEGVSGKFAAIENDFTSDTILKPTVVYHQNSVALEAVQGLFARIDGLTPNQKAVALTLDSAAHDKRAGAIFEYLDYRKLNKLPGDLDKIAPEELTSVFTIGTSLAKVQSGNIQRRAGDIRSGSGGFSAEGLAVNGTGPGYSGSFRTGAAGPTGNEIRNDGKDVKETKDVIAPAENRWGVFLSGTGEWVSVGDTDNARGYTLESGGFTLGIDYKVTPNFAVGLAAGYTGSSADLTDRGRVYVNGGKLGLYATFFQNEQVSPAPTMSKDAKEVQAPAVSIAKGFYADVAVFGGYNSYDTRRSALQGEARGDTEGGELNVLFGTGYDFKKGNFTFGPTASFNYTYLGTDAFTEHGSLAPLNIHGGKGESLRTAFGIKASYDWKVGSVLIKPEIRAAWQHEFGDAAYALDSSFANGAGNTFRVNGPEIGRDSALLGAGFAVQFNERFSTYFYYDGELGAKNYQSTSVTGGVRLAF